MPEKLLPDSIRIRSLEEKDWDATWQVLEPVFRAGETYPYSPDITMEQAYQSWVVAPTVTYVAEVDGEILGTYYVKPNQPSLGAHVCNCGYVVSVNARRRGVASGMCEHSQREAVALGFRCMQFNLVVSTNEASVTLWKKMGFTVVGTLPEAFHHKRLGYVDALMMYKKLVK